MANAKPDDAQPNVVLVYPIDNNTKVGVSTEQVDVSGTNVQLTWKVDDTAPEWYFAKTPTGIDIKGGKGEFSDPQYDPARKTAWLTDKDGPDRTQRKKYTYTVYLTNGVTTIESDPTICNET